MIRKYTSIIFVCLIMSLFCGLLPAQAQDMADYVAYPPFLFSGVKPNLLLMFDNSASMYDLAYVDNGNAPVRQSSYCYDQTYDSANKYAGYFETDTVYAYNFTNGRFEEGTFPLVCSHKNGELCVNIVSGSPSTVNKFVARGNYLNWLASSKFDVQKQILTGGKYNTTTNQYIAESRGCVGRRYIKEALKADYVEGGVNASLGVTFAINGPVNSVNPTAPSLGGQSYIQIFEGNYNEVLCQTAITAVNDANNPSVIRQTVSDCLSYDPNSTDVKHCSLDAGKVCTVDSDCLVLTQAGTCSVGKKGARTCLAPADMVGKSCVVDADCNTYDNFGPCSGATHSGDVNSKIAFNQSMQECWQVWSGKKAQPDHDAYMAESQKCTEIYAGYKICNGGDKDGNTCTVNADCPGGGTCQGGPSALRPGNPGLMCSTSYTGYCASTANNWATTTWVQKEYASAEACFIAKYSEYCGDVKVPPVIDPSDTPDETSETANLPAIISDIGIEAQLGAPIAKLKANRYDTTAPTGLIHEYSDSIRFGAMAFNFDGSEYECGLSAVDNLNCPKVCSVTKSRVCTTSIDCPAGETCTAAMTNKDAGTIIHYIGTGNCSVTTATTCVRDDQCPIGETCVETIGDHSEGLIKAIDDIRADTWTPFAEAYYNAIAYFVKNATDNSDLDATKFTAAGNAIKEPLNAADFVSNKNPILTSCQKNNILIISDGTSTADLDPAMKAKVSDGSNLFNDGDPNDPALCGDYSGSSLLDDLSYFAKHRNIFNPSDNDPDDNDAAQSITTYVVYTGIENSTESGECVPKTLMENTALNGGTDLYNPQDASSLAVSLRNAFKDIGSGSASGTAISVLSTTGSGEGAVYQAYFYPTQMEGSEFRTWIGHVQSLFVDQYGNLREDSNNNKTLDLIDDYILKMEYTKADGTKIRKCSDSNGDGIANSCTDPQFIMEEINAIWKAGYTLWETDPATRTLFTTINGYDPVNFITGNSASLKPYLRAADNTESDNIINWIRGDDLTGITDAGHADGYRKRDLTDDQTNQTHVWKLGDIIYSTPTVVAGPIENYDLLYNDPSYAEFRQTYRKRRQVVYVGSNDGMLHAFNAGCYSDIEHKFYSDVDNSGTCVTGTHVLGQELWGFIPRGLLPHLQWLTDPNYRHVFYVDLKPKVTDVKIFNDDAVHVGGWGTILIGGFRYGGKNISWSSGGMNYSASPEYFALDITDPLDPKLLWTFSNPSLGLSMSYPALAKVADDWYAIFGSGPSSSVNGYDEFSDLKSFQNGNVFAIKLSAGLNGSISSWTLNTNYWKIPTGNSAAFLTDPITVDVDIDNDVDVIYIGENYQAGGVWNGLMRRITTSKGNQLTPSLWTLSTLGNIDSIAGINDASKKITSAPSAAMDNMGKLYVYFGTGQFYGSLDRNLTDTGAFYAIKDGCWSGECATSYTNLLNASTSTVNTDGTVGGVTGACAGATSTWSDLATASNTCDGWAIYFKNLGETIDFTGATLTHAGERVLGKPLILGGLVSWASYIPGTENCSFEGNSNVYAVYYKTGTAYKDYVFKDQANQENPSDTVARVKSLGEGMPSSLSAQITTGGTVKGFAQQSTGSILEIENITPISLKSGINGWKSEEIE